MSTSASSDNKVLAALAWIFAPLVGLFFLSHQDAELKWHAKRSVVYGVVMIVFYVLMFVAGFVFAFLGALGLALASLLSCVNLIVWIADVAVRLYAAYQAYEGKRWELPVIRSLFNK